MVSVVEGHGTYQASGKEANAVLYLFIGIIAIILILYFLVRKSVTDIGGAVTKPFSDAGAWVASVGSGIKTGGKIATDNMGTVALYSNPVTAAGMQLNNTSNAISNFIMGTSNEDWAFGTPNIPTAMQIAWLNARAAQPNTTPIDQATVDAINAAGTYD